MVSRSSTHITPLIWLAKSLKREVSLLLFVPSIGTGESGNGASAAWDGNDYSWALWKELAVYKKAV